MSTMLSIKLCFMESHDQKRVILLVNRESGQPPSTCPFHSLFFSIIDITFLCELSPSSSRLCLLFAPYSYYPHSFQSFFAVIHLIMLPHQLPLHQQQPYTTTLSMLRKMDLIRLSLEFKLPTDGSVVNLRDRLRVYLNAH